MPWDLENLNPPVRCYIGEESTPEWHREWIELRVASEEDNRVIFKKLGIKEKVEYRTEQRTRAIQRISYIDVSDEQRELFNDELWDYCIVHWYLLSADNQEIPCTRENKCRLMRQSPKFALLVSDNLEKLRESLEVQKELVTKN